MIDKGSRESDACIGFAPMDLRGGALRIEINTACLGVESEEEFVYVCEYLYVF